jgi:hypothetical protein
MVNCLCRVLCWRVVTYWNYDENFENNRNLRRAFCGDCTPDNRCCRRARPIPNTCACAVTAIRWYRPRRAGANSWRWTSDHRCWLWRLLAPAALSSQIGQAGGVSSPRAYKQKDGRTGRAKMRGSSELECQEAFAEYANTSRAGSNRRPTVHAKLANRGRLFEMALRRQPSFGWLLSLPMTW